MKSDLKQAADALFITVGRPKSTIPVQISYRIIELFSEGLYSSPHKAIEELVANSFDAGATHVHVLLSADLKSDGSTIAVIDDGEGMDEKGFVQHWLIGASNKRDSKVRLHGREQIGKFGIGKLATFVLAYRLSHLSKRNGRYFATTMDYTAIPPAGKKHGVVAKKPVKIKLRELAEPEARLALDPWLNGAKEGFKALKLFGRGASTSWTVAIMSHLKPMADEIQRGRLHWVLSTAMPLRDDFELYLDGDEVKPAKISQPRLGEWVLGKDLLDLPSPAPDDGEKSVDQTSEASSPQHFGLSFRGLGRVTGYLELFKDAIDAGKSEDLGRSNGFFVYVRGRLINVDDPGFGIERNKLRHGTFSRFRLVMHANGLDDELRSSREAIRAGPKFNLARNVAHGVFNFARAYLEKKEAEAGTGSHVSSRVDATPAALTRRPLAAMIEGAFDGKYAPWYSTVPRDLDEESRQRLLGQLRSSGEEATSLVSTTALVDLAQDQPIAVFDLSTGCLQINMLHPFVAYFLGDYENKQTSLPLELLAMAEVLYEAQLYAQGIDPGSILEALTRRDLLLRHLARSTGRRNARMVAQALQDAASDKKNLELEVVAAFDSMGFQAVPLGGSGRADGRAMAWLSATSEKKRQSYAVSLEAKSKERPGDKVSAKAVHVSTIARHRKAQDCDHAVVVAPDFQGQNEGAALASEVAADRTTNPGKTITLIRIFDLARLVRLVTIKHIALNRLRELFVKCSMPDEAETWIDALRDETAKRPPYRRILDTIDLLQREWQDEPVEFSSLRVKLKEKHSVTLSNDELEIVCRTLQNLVPKWLTVHERSVELHTRPDKIMDALRAAIGEYPEEEQAASDLNKK